MAIKSIADCGKDMPKILTDARNNAISALKRDVFKHMQGRFKQRTVVYNGNVGAMAYNNTLAISQTHAGLVLNCKAIRGASITVNRVHVAFNATVQFVVAIYRAVRGYSNTESLQTITIDAQAGALKENVLTTPLQLPLTDTNGNAYDYYFVYELAGFQPKDNVTSCRCGLSENDLHQYLSVAGIVTNDTASLSAATRTGHVNGLVLGIEAMCGSEDILCQSYKKNEAIRVAIQWAVLTKAVENLIRGILNSDAINRYTLAKREQMGYNASRLLKKFNNDAQWIAENIDINGNDCYICNDQADTYYKTGILA